MRDEDMETGPPPASSMARNAMPIQNGRLNVQIVAAIITKTREAWVSPAISSPAARACATDRPRLDHPYLQLVSVSEDFAV